MRIDIKWGDKKPRRRPPPVSAAAARGALAAACERLYRSRVGSRCLQASTGSRVSSQSQVSVTAVPCNHIRPGHTHNWQHVCLFVRTTCDDQKPTQQTYVLSVQCSSTCHNFTTPCTLYSPKKHTSGREIQYGSNAIPPSFSNMASPSRWSRCSPFRCSATSLLLSLILISSLASAAPKSRSSKLKVGLTTMHNEEHNW